MQKQDKAQSSAGNSVSYTEPSTSQNNGKDTKKTAFLLHSKKGQLALLANPVTLLIVALILLIILGFSFGFAVFAVFNIFSILGGFLIVIGGLAFSRGVDSKTSLWLIALGVILLLVPGFIEGFRNLTF